MYLLRPIGAQCYFDAIVIPMISVTSISLMLF